MSNVDIIRAWKDKEYCSNLTELQRSQVPENPAGAIELTDEELSSVNGGTLGLGSGPIGFGDGLLEFTNSVDVPSFGEPSCGIPALRDLGIG